MKYCLISIYFLFVALDYVVLLIPPDDFVSKITFNLTQDDLPILCKFLKSLPTQLSSKCQYTQSLLYKEWCKKHIYEVSLVKNLIVL